MAPHFSLSGPGHRVAARLLSMKHFWSFVPLLTFVAFLGFSPAARGAELQPPPGGKIEETNTQEALRAYLQLQEQLHATQMAVEQNRKDAAESASRAAAELGNRLQGIEHALSLQRARELEAMQSSNRVMLVVAGSFAALGFLAMVLMAYFQWRTVNGLAEISAALPPVRALGPGSALAALGPGDLPGAAAEQSNLRLLGAMEQLEKRIHELEHTSLPSLARGAEFAPAPSNGNGAHLEPVPAAGTPGATGRPEVLLAKGESLLSLGQYEEALACFDAALELEPGQGEALVKKGSALEKMNRVDQAIECYDRAIQVDSSLTIAYLHKGGLFNRMERYHEALECYEKALQTQEKKKTGI